METVAEHDEIEAEYQLEAEVKCGSCSQMIETLQVLRLLRSRVNFTSSLPRRGFVVVCPQCRGVISGHLGSKIPI